MLVTVLGGSGFVGRHIVKALAKRGHRVRVACRRPDLAGYVMTAGAIGQIGLVQCNLRYPASVQAACAGADVIINCVGLLSENGRQSFAAVQAKGAETIAKAAGDARIIHISAIGANAKSESKYATSKASAETALASDKTVILRPSLVFGAEDKLFNRFAKMAIFSPFIPLVGTLTKFQPVYVGELAEIAVNAAEGLIHSGTYEIGGPEVLTLKAIIEKMLVTIGRKRLIIDLPHPVAKIMGSILQFMPGKPLTPDQVILLQTDNVVTGNPIITSTSIESIIPSYLWRYRPEGQFNELAIK